MEKVCNSFHILLNYFKFCYWFPLCSLEELANILSLICLFFWILLVVFAIQKFSVFMLTYLHHFYIHGFVFILRKPIFTWRLWNIFLFSSHIFIVPFFFFLYIWLVSPSGVYFTARFWVGIQPYCFRKTWLIVLIPLVE